MFHLVIFFIALSLSNAQYYYPSYGQYAYQTYLPAYSQYQAYPYQTTIYTQPQSSYYYPSYSYPRNSLASEYQRYQELNKLIQNQITGIMSDPTQQVESMDPRHSILRPRILKPYMAGGKIYSVTPHGLKGLSVNKYGVHKGHLLGSAAQGDGDDQSGAYTGHVQSTRSISTNGTDSGNGTSTLTVNDKIGYVAEKSAVNGSIPAEIPKLESLNESEDKLVDPRAIGEILPGYPLQPYRVEFADEQQQPIATLGFNTNNSPNAPSAGTPPSQLMDQVRPDFSNMELYNKNEKPADQDRSAHQHKSPQSHPAYSETTPSSGSWLTDTYQTYLNQARSFPMQPYGGGYMPGYGMPHMGGMYPPMMPPYGGYGHHQGGSSASSTASSTSSSNNGYQTPYGYRTAMDFVGKGLNYEPQDWARYGQHWANQGISALNNYVDSSNNAPAVNDIVGKPWIYQPHDWARYGQQWVNHGITNLQHQLSHSKLSPRHWF